MTKPKTKTKAKDKKESIAEKLNKVPIHSGDIEIPAKSNTQTNVGNTELSSAPVVTPNNQTDEEDINEKYEEIRNDVSEGVSNLFDRWEEKEFAPQDFETDIPIDSLEASIGYSSLLRQMQHAFVRRVAYYRSEAGGGLSVSEARERAFHACTNTEEAKKEFNMMLSLPIENLNFVDLMELHSLAPRVAERFWENAKREGRKEFESGHLAANINFPADYIKQLWNIARYLGVRESFIDDWNPQGGIEVAMIDMLAQSYFQWQYWLEQTVKRSETKPREEHYKYQEWKRWQKELQKAKSWEEGYWFPPYVSEQRAIEHAVQMADRFNRIFLRTLRQLRDLRRYSPVTINNPNQVNIAADGGQQVNVSNKDEDEKKKITS
ncbi:MAG: hypothetical protein ACR2GD_10065 [Pyrinomonadaceae bacterium]